MNAQRKPRGQLPVTSYWLLVIKLLGNRELGILGLIIP